MDRNNRTVLIFFCALGGLIAAILIAARLANLEAASQWIAFWGGLIGAFLGALGAAFAVILTYVLDRRVETRRQNVEDEQMAAALAEELKLVAAQIVTFRRHWYWASQGETPLNIADAGGYLPFVPLVYQAMLPNLFRLRADIGKPLILCHAALATIRRLQPTWPGLVDRNGHLPPADAATVLDGLRIASIAAAAALDAMNIHDVAYHALPLKPDEASLQDALRDQLFRAV